MLKLTLKSLACGIIKLAEVTSRGEAEGKELDNKFALRDDTWFQLLCAFKRVSVECMVTE